MNVYDEPGGPSAGRRMITSLGPLRPFHKRQQAESQRMLQSEGCPPRPARRNDGLDDDDDDDDDGGGHGALGTREVFAVNPGRYWQCLAVSRRRYRQSAWPACRYQAAM